jgi:5''-nucleotidase/2'',3''-cyclic phosphodiesterase and related esterases
MKKFFTFLASLVLSLSLLPVTLMQVAAIDDKQIVILYTNDVHCAYDQVMNKEKTEVTNIGYSAVAAYKKAMQEQYTNVALVDAGDHSQGAPLGTLTKGTALIDIMNHVGYDFAAIGNHEFDYDMAQLLTNINSASYQYLSCNFTKADGTAIDNIKPYAVKDFNGTKVAFVGITTPESFTKSTPTYFQDSNGNYLYSFAEGNNGQDLYTKVQQAIDDAKAEGAQYVVALSHLGTDAESSPWTSKEVIANTTGFNVVLDAHSHSTIESENVKDKIGNTVVLTSTGTELAALGKLVIDPVNDTVTTQLLKGLSTTDSDTDTYIAGINDQFNTLLNKVVAHSNVKLTIMTPDGSTRAVRNAETNLADLCADAYRIQMGTDVGFANAGGIRQDIPAGDITYGQIINVEPFGNTVCVVEVTGQQLLDALEMGAKNYPDENGAMMQVSGIMYTINAKTKSTVQTDDKGMFISVTGARRVENVKVLDKATGKYLPIDPQHIYTAASINYIIKSAGGGMNMFLNDKILQDGVKLDNQILIEYIQDYLKGDIGDEYASLTGQNRISFLTVDYQLLSDSSDKVININGNASALTALYLDGVLLDESSYVVTGIDTNISFTQDFRSTLKAGAHTIRAVYKDGDITATIDLAEMTPPTGDATDLFGWLVLELTSIAGVAEVLRIKKRFA